MSQNFTNCHTKIRHVDAHATLNDGVVVQVMGLLSNNNQALRRFMQTFVLAPEVWKKKGYAYLFKNYSFETSDLKKSYNNRTIIQTPYLEPLPTVFLFTCHFNSEPFENRLETSCLVIRRYFSEHFLSVRNTLHNTVQLSNLESTDVNAVSNL